MKLEINISEEDLAAIWANAWGVNELKTGHLLDMQSQVTRIVEEHATKAKACLKDELPQAIEHFRNAYREQQKQLMINAMIPAWLPPSYPYQPG
jgi:hypothetical protein